MKKFLPTMVNGFLFAIPLVVSIYIAGRLLVSLEKSIQPMAEKIGAHQLLGEFTLLIVAVALIMIGCFVLGVLLQRAAFLRVVGDSVEGVAVRVIPTLGYLKSMAREKLDIQATDSWKGILLKDGESWLPAFLIEETAQWHSVFIPEAPRGDGGEVRIFPRDGITYKVVDLGVVRAGLRVYGKGISAHL